MKILLAVDGSTYSDAAIKEIAQRPWPPESELKVVTVAEIPVMPGMEFWTASPSYFTELEKAVRESAQSVIDAALRKLNSTRSLEISSEVIEGLPRQTILEEAERWGADLIVMGSRGLGAWSRLLLGSVSTSVVQHAPCSVEVVRSLEAS